VSAKKATGRHRHELFVNRELSWLEFNARVLEEAQDRANPLMERIRFATIVQSSLDEFFMVRVARLGREVRAGRTGQDRSGMTPSQQLEAISARAHRMVDDLYALLTGELLPALAAEGIRLCGVEEIGEEQRSALLRQFKREIAPVLTPLGVDSARPFPVLASLSLNVAVLLEPEEGCRGSCARSAAGVTPGCGWTHSSPRSCRRSSPGSASWPRPPSG
jgi:polyphosphate kinase